MALLETGTQSLLPVNTNLMGPAAWEEPQQLGKDGMYKKWTIKDVSGHLSKKQREGKSGSVANCRWLEERLRGMTMCWRDALAAPPGCRILVMLRTLWNASTGPLCLFTWSVSIQTIDARRLYHLPNVTLQKSMLENVLGGDTQIYSKSQVSAGKNPVHLVT